MTNEQLAALVVALGGDLEKLKANLPRDPLNASQNFVIVTTNSVTSSTPQTIESPIGKADWVWFYKMDDHANVSFDDSTRTIVAYPRMVIPASFHRFTITPISTAFQVGTGFIFACMIGKGPLPPWLPSKADQTSRYLPANDVSCGAGATTQIFAGRQDLVRLSVSVKSTAANGLKLGSSTAGASQGLEIAPGQIHTLMCPADLYAYNAGAGAVSASILGEIL